TLCFAGMASGIAAGRADTVTLKCGGEIRGELVSDAASQAGARRISVRTVSGAMISVESDQVEAVVHRRPIVEEYHTRRRAAPDTPVAQWELSEWCRQNSLPNERADHLQRVIALDPEHGAAHRGLGHVRNAG